MTKSKIFYQHILQLEKIKHTTQESNIRINSSQTGQGYISVSKSTNTYPDAFSTSVDTYAYVTTNNHKTTTRNNNNNNKQIMKTKHNNHNK